MDKDSKQSKQFQDHFSHNTTFLVVGGIWSPDEDIRPFRKVIWNIYNILNLCSCIGFSVLELISLPITITNLKHFIKNMNMAMQHILASVKVIMWFCKRKQITKIIETLKEKSSAYEPFEDLQPEQILKEEMKSKKIADCCWLFSAANVSNSAIINCLVIFSFRHKDFDNYFMDANNATVYRYTQTLPYFSIIPWNYEASYFLFNCALILQWHATLIYAFIIVGFDSLFTSIANYSSAQMRILQWALKTIRARSMYKLNLSKSPSFVDSDELSQEMDKEMNKCIDHLQTIFRMTAEMETIFSYLTLLQVLVSLIIFCTCLYLVTDVTVLSGSFWVEFIYMVAIIWQIFQYCYFGNKITLMGDDLPTAIYEGDWFSARKSFKIKMLITMTRMRRPIHFTIGKFSTLTLSTFVTISRASYSFFTFLKNKEQLNQQ